MHGSSCPTHLVRIGQQRMTAAVPSDRVWVQAPRQEGLRGSLYNRRDLHMGMLRRQMTN